MQSESAFSAVWESLNMRGYSIVPIAPGTKRPGFYDPSRSQWRARDGWDQYFHRLMNEQEIEAAESWPACNIGVCLGRLSGVVALDLDATGELADRLLTVIPPSPVQKIGSKGFTRFYRYNGENSRTWSASGDTALELLSDGRQTVIPPSIHPDTGQPYYWAPDSLTDVDASELPTLPENFADQVAVVLEPYRATSTSGGGQLGDEITPFELGDDDLPHLQDALRYLDPRPESNWVRVGMALKSIGDVGFDLWDEWSQGAAEKYAQNRPGFMRDKWNRWRVCDGGLTYRTLLADASQLGWRSEHVFGPRVEIKPGVEGNLARAALRQFLREGHSPEEFGLTPEQCIEFNVPQPKRGLFITLAKDLGEVEAPNWLIKTRLVMDSLAVIYGPSGAGKTFIALDMALHVASSNMYHGMQVNAGNVLYVAGEGQAGIRKRIRAWCLHNQVDAENVQLGVTSQPVPMLDARAVEELSVQIGKTMPGSNLKMIVIDTLNRNFGDGDENSTRDMTGFIEQLDNLRLMYQCCVVVVHHSGLNENARARGSSALRAALDTELRVNAPKDHPGFVTLTCTKQKDAEAFAPTWFKTPEVELGLVDGEMVTSLVTVPTDDPNGAVDGLVADIKGKAAQAIALMREVLTSLEWEARAAAPDAPTIEIEKSDLVGRLQEKGRSKSAAYRDIDKAQADGWLKSMIQRPVATYQITLTS
jgi:hypothetical protein